MAVVYFKEGDNGFTSGDKTERGGGGTGISESGIVPQVDGVRD